MVVVRSAPAGAEQNDPAPCVGYTGVASGSVSSLRTDAYCDRASDSVCSGPDRSVRAAAPTSSDPPVNTPSTRPPSSSRYARCSAVWPGVTQARNARPPRSTSSPSASPR